ncbi:hypothetical protein Pmani_002305 [Petrolisthes manimaculis]|uniref:Uncharacterized protein n=1 Tax=Petrolisthes manimaculis TaxID=1843537 RepID=A0AAE1QIM9_9EUCA|nr:hypothetical protein Pmani_002305 [Petrolisthes manimaculis]
MRKIPKNEPWRTLSFASIGDRLEQLRTGGWWVHHSQDGTPRRPTAGISRATYKVGTTKNEIGGALDANLTVFTNAVNKAAEKSIPRKRTGARHRDYWIYCDEIREQNRKINKHRKLHRRNPTAESHSLLREILARKLECIQRTIYGFPLWTKTEVMQHEPGLGSIQDRIDYVVSFVVARTIHHYRDNLFKGMVIKELRKNRQSAKRGTWIRRVADTVYSLFKVNLLLKKGTDSLAGEYCVPPPWTTPAIKTEIVRLPRGKKDLSEYKFFHHTNRVMGSRDDEDTAVYYTDGFVDPEGGRAGAAFVLGNSVFGWRTIYNCSSVFPL